MCCVGGGGVVHARTYVCTYVCVHERMCVGVSVCWEYQLHATTKPNTR